LVDTTDTTVGRGGAEPAKPASAETYDRRALTYANSFDDPWTSFAIKTIE